MMIRWRHSASGYCVDTVWFQFQLLEAGNMRATAEFEIDLKKTGNHLLVKEHVFFLLVSRLLFPGALLTQVNSYGEITAIGGSALNLQHIYRVGSTRIPKMASWNAKR